jgi:PAS domain S-box-containing protein
MIQEVAEQVQISVQAGGRAPRLRPASPVFRTLGPYSDSIVENVNVWLNVLDTELNIVLWNRMAETISGFSRAEVLGHNRIWEWLYPDEAYRRSITVRVVPLLERDSTLEYLETRIRCKNGESKTILWSSRSLLDEPGTVYGVITFGYDITDRKQAEEALQKAHREISALYHVASVASASLDLDTILERSLDCVLETMKSEQGLIHLWDEGNEILRLAAQQGMGPELMAQIDAVPPGKGLTGWVFEHGEPLMTPNLGIDPSVPQALCENLFKAYVGVPMRAKGKVVGVFSVLGEAGRRFGSDEVTLLASIADQVGVAVENARLYQQAEQLAVMEERERLAHDLHDSVTQSLYSLTLLAEAARRLIRAGEAERASDYLTRLGETAHDALKEMRLLVYRLRPSALEREGLVGAIQQRLGAVERRAGVKAHLLSSDTIKLPAPVEEGLYRITQEALNNALKHAMASSVTVHIQVLDGHVELEVADNGVGFDPGAPGHREGMGLVSMRERAKKLGGMLRVLSAPGQGTRVSVWVRAEPGSGC